MKLRFKHYVLFIAALSSAHIAFGQSKVEREKSVKANDVPQMAIEWMKDTYEGPKRIRWVIEESNQGISYEAKLRHKKQWHSVEFNIDGEVEDIEVILDPRSLDGLLLERLEASLDEAFDRYRILKLQRQWSGSSDDLEDAIDEGELDAVTTRYEIEITGTKEKEEQLWEVLLDEAGKMISFRPIAVGMNTNLNY